MSTAYDMGRMPLASTPEHANLSTGEYDFMFGGAEAPMPVITVQDVKNRPSPPHEPFVEQARGAPIEDEFEQHWNATETSETHFFTDGTWLPKYI